MSNFSLKRRIRLVKNTLEHSGNLSRAGALDRSTRIVIPAPLEDSRFSNTKVFWTRESAIKSLRVDPKSILEVGTLAGDFANFFLSVWNPTLLTLVDYFDAQDYVFGEQRFTPETHFDYVANRFSKHPEVELRKGESQTVLADLIREKKKFDFIYIDAGHTFEDVNRDIELAHILLNPGGILGMNDYIMTDYYYDTTYGVVQATNRFLNDHLEYGVVAFAFNTNLFADIYLQKVS